MTRLWAAAAMASLACCKADDSPSEPDGPNFLGVPLPQGLSCGGVADQVRIEFRDFTNASFTAALEKDGLELTKLEPEEASSGYVGPDLPHGLQGKRKPPAIRRNKTSRLWEWSTDDDRNDYPEFVRNGKGAIFVLTRKERVLERIVDARCECPPPPPAMPPTEITVRYRIDGHKTVEYDAKIIDVQYFPTGECLPPA